MLSASLPPWYGRGVVGRAERLTSHSVSFIEQDWLSAVQIAGVQAQRETVCGRRRRDVGSPSSRDNQDLDVQPCCGSEAYFCDIRTLGVGIGALTRCWHT